MQKIIPEQIGVYITEDDTRSDTSVEKYGFVNIEEFQDYIKENLGPESYFIIYTYELGAMKVLGCGTREELEF